MTTKRSSMARARTARRAARRAVPKIPPMTPQRAMQGPRIAREGTLWEGASNAEALEVLVELLGGPPVVGDLYRVGLMQGPDGRKVQFVGEYVGLVMEFALDEVSRAHEAEPALRFIVRNPSLPAGSDYGTRENPFVAWPIDLWHLRPAQPGDLETPIPIAVEGEVATPPPGRPRIN